MVSFVAQEPDINPANSAFWGRPIREPKVDVSGETIGRTIGGALKEGLAFADDYMREGVVKPNVNIQTNEIRDQFVDALNTARNSVEPQPLGAPQTLTADARAKLPTQVQNVGQNVDMLQKAMESGKLSETDYYGRLDALAKQMRSQYPGYKDEVDREIARVTGVHPANQYIRSQIQDLNRLISQHQDKRDKFDSILDRAAFQGMFSDDQMEHFQNMHRDHPDQFGVPELIREINRKSFDKASFERKKEEAFDKTATAKDQAQKADEAITSIASNMTSDAMHMEKITVGVYSGQSMDDFYAAFGQGKAEISEVDAQNIGRRSLAQYNQIYAEVMRRANEPDPNDPQHRSLAQQLKGGEKSLEQVVKSAMDPWKRRVDAFAGNDPIMGNLNGKLVEAAHNDSANNMRVNDPHIFNLGVMAETLRKQWGPNFDGAISSSPVWQTKVVPELQGMLDQAWLAARTQPRMAAGGRPYELVNDIRNYANQPREDKNYLPTLAKGIDEFNAKDTDPATRKALAYYFFGPNSGQLVVNATKGDDAVYRQFYTPLTARTMAKQFPDLYPMFESGAEQNAKALFTTAINDMKTILQNQAPGTAGIEWHGDHFEGTGEGRLLIQDKIARINTMIAGLKPVYDTDPEQKTDIETFMFHRLAVMGFNPTKNITGLPEQIMRALHAARGDATDMQRDVINPASGQ